MKAALESPRFAAVKLASAALNWISARAKASAKPFRLGQRSHLAPLKVLVLVRSLAESATESSSCSSLSSS